MFRSVGEWERETTLGSGDAADLADAILKTWASLGIKGLPGRFAEYLPLLRVADTFQSCPLPWPPGTRERQLFFEGVSQVRHLLQAAEVCRELSPGVVKHKMSKALAGNALPDPTSQIDRQARDFLIEFSSAYVFKERGFDVTMPIEEKREDVRARVAGLPDLAIECKRPESLGSIRNGVKDGCDKLRELCDGKTTMGMLVVCVDRLIDKFPGASVDNPEIPSFPSKAAFQAWMDEVFQAGIVGSVLAEKRARRRLYPEIPIVTLLVTTVAFVNEDEGGGFLHVPSHLAPYNTGGSWEGFPALRRMLFSSDEPGPDLGAVARP
jgi:hypothetical protein